MSIIADTTANSKRQHEEFGFSVTTSTGPNSILTGIEIRWFDRALKKWRWRQVVSQVPYTGGVPSTAFFHWADFKGVGVEVPDDKKIEIMNKIEEKALAFA